ncbi:MAG: hypothetical protein HY834_14775 [Devosia nanyangense]|uniref:Uncharacterized protein n=1 Tax=Devosia nanyangense TaxID=1228055 RepID=A0A933L603_9HYPH|nr:hypothetical protein [Devosia nanyangense]
MMKPTHEPEPGFEIVSGGHRIRHPMADLAEVNATMDEIAARQKSTAPLAVASIDSDKVWANYRRGKGTPTPASTLTSTSTSTHLERTEVERRLKR